MDQQISKKPPAPERRLEEARLYQVLGQAHQAHASAAWTTRMLRRMLAEGHSTHRADWLARLRKACSAERIAREAYARALDAFADFVLGRRAG